MVDLTTLNPTDDSFPIATSMNQSIELGLIAPGNPSLGSGTLTTYLSNAFLASGSYSIPVKGGGNWSVQVSENPDATWNIQLIITGPASLASFSSPNAIASVPAGNEIKFTNPLNPTQWILLSQDNGGWFTCGKITIVDSATSSLMLYICINS